MHHFSSRWPSSKPTTSTEVTETKVTSTTPRTKSKTNIIIQDISAFLPSGYKKEDTAVTESSLLSDILAKSKVDISALLPPDYNKKKLEEESKSKSTTMTTTTTSSTTAKSTHVSPGKIASSIQDLFASSKVDISALLPKDYEQKKKDLTSDSEIGDANSKQNATVTERPDSESPTTKKTGSLKIVFPSRPGGRKPIHKITTPHTPRGDGPGAVTLKIQKGWPTR